jgi:hypothetical protein
MSAYAASVICCLLLPVGMLICAIAGHRIGRKRFLANPDAEQVSTGTVDAAILSLLGLLTAFTFSTAYLRYEARRQLIVDEANAIGTAYLRLDLMPTEHQDRLRKLFREYVGSRYALWERLPIRSQAEATFAESTRLQNEIWAAAVKATEHEAEGDARKLFLPALNEMIDITTTRLIAVQAHPPLIIFALLGGLALAAAVISGYGMARSARPSYPHLVGFALVSAIALYVILDIEFPRHGFVTLDAAHELLRGLEEQMK